jgi:Fe-S cluster assembly protein SufD
LPSTAEEDWRYSRIDALDLGRYAPAAGDYPAAVALPLPELLLAEIGPRGALVRVRDGVVVDVELDPVLEKDGVQVQSLAAMTTDAPLTMAGLELLDEPFADLADALLVDALVITVPAAVQLELPIVVLHDLGGQPDIAVAPRTKVNVGAGAQAKVIEVFRSGDEPLLALPVAELDVEATARLSYLSIQELGATAWQFGYQLSSVAADASLQSFSAALGGDYARLCTRSALVGENASSQLLAAYFGSGSGMRDFRTFQEHLAPRSRSQLVFKGAVADEAQSVYTGLVHIANGARRSDASQTNRNLVLSVGARAYSVPNLNIEENDVRCSHASTVGPIDPEQRFYLECRGVPSEVADRLILLGFFEDLLDDIPDAGVARYLRDAIAVRVDSGAVLAQVTQ